MASKPKKVEIRAYNVGFGDCFLLTFHYPSTQKHVLIDFGTTSPPKGDPKLLDVARLIEEQCGGPEKGKLDAVIATHRHKDHIGGFATNAKGTASGDIIRRLADRGKALVVQPWTERPDAPTGLPAGGKKSSKKKPLSPTALYLAQLEDMHRFAAAIARETARLARTEMDAAVGEQMFRAETVGTEREADDDQLEERRMVTVATDMAGTTASKSLINKLRFIGEDNVKNLKAVKNLMEMGARHEYLSFGSDTLLERVLPGVKVHVLGPPTIEQYAKVQTQRREDEAEFWMLRKQFWQMQAANAARTVREAIGDLFPSAARHKQIPRSSRWFVRRLRGTRAKQLLELVLIMDEAMNNTSVILLFEVGGRKLLFPGDAQIENWEYALKKAWVRKLLADVDLYKVGHHGSRNATPKTLWALFRNRSVNENARRRLRSMISTKSKVHGHIERNTEVPRKTLVAALEAETRYVTTSGKKVVVETFDL